MTLMVTTAAEMLALLTMLGGLMVKRSRLVATLRPARVHR